MFLVLSSHGSACGVCGGFLMYTLQKSLEGEVMLQRCIRVGFWGALCLALMVGASQAWAAEPYYIDSATLGSSSAVPQRLVDGLNQRGWVLYTESNGLKEQICEIFLAKAVETQSAKPASSHINYGRLKPGALVGVVHLLPEATEDYSADSHDQKLKPGYYTMRYAVMPAGTYEHGVELGDFVVLSPVSMDQDPGRILKPEELAEFGASSTGTDTAATMPLVASDTSAQTFPNVTMDDAGICTFHARLQLASMQGSTSKELEIAIVMLTPVPHPEGS